MSNLTRPTAGAKVYNRDLHLSPGASLFQNGDFVTQSVCKTIVANADHIDQNLFTANRKWRVVGVSEVHTTAGTDAGTVTATIRKCTGTQAPASGTALHSTSLNMKGTAQTVQSPAVDVAESTATLDTGDRLAIDFTGTITSLAGVCVTVDLIAA